MTSKRHPEKQRNISSYSIKKPDWLKVKAPSTDNWKNVKNLMNSKSLVTVCEEAACPNIGECWARKHATMMILGSVCTRACAFCNVATGRPDLLDPHEPENVGKAVAKLGLRHVVITSVDRDDLDDGGAQHFAETISCINRLSPSTTIEVLTPDFLRKDGAVEIVVKARPDVFNHNLETVPRLYKKARPGASYEWSLKLLKEYKSRRADVITKSGLMLGLGEEIPEVETVLQDLRSHDVDMVTLGQYLQPSKDHLKVERFLHPDEFENLRLCAEKIGFKHVASGPLVRSSYHADKQAHGENVS